MDRDRLQRAFVRLAEVMARLRKDCPWDRRQTHASLRRYLLEESHEVLEALDEGDDGKLRQELGDLLFQVWFHAEIASERPEEGGGFDLADVLEGITAKLERRHPHVFGEARADDAAAVVRNWEKLKLAEDGRTSVLDGVPRALPALAASQAVQDKAAAIGFDWEKVGDVAAKVREEVEEFLAELPPERVGARGAPPPSDRTDAIASPIEDPARSVRMASEFGDLLFALVNYGRHLGLGAEDCLREANRRFERRFRAMEELARGHGRALADMTLEEMDILWREVKAREAAGEGKTSTPSDLEPTTP